MGGGGIAGHLRRERGAPLGLHRRLRAEGVDHHNVQPTRLLTANCPVDVLNQPFVAFHHSRNLACIDDVALILSAHTQNDLFLAQRFRNAVAPSTQPDHISASLDDKPTRDPSQPLPVVNAA